MYKLLKNCPRGGISPVRTNPDLVASDLLLYKGHCPLLEFSFPEFSLLSFQILTNWYKKFEIEIWYKKVY